MTRSRRRFSSAANSLPKLSERVVGAVSARTGSVKPQTWLRSSLPSVAEALVEAGDQVRLGDQHVDRRPHAELLGQLLQARAQLRRVFLALGRVLLQQVLDVDGQQHAVDRPARPRLAQQREEAVPRAPASAVAVGLLRRVAAGGVDQHRLVGEPPVAVARAADAAHAAGAHLLGQREGEPGVEQRRRLARAGRADEDVPGQLVQVGAAPEAASALAACAPSSSTSSACEKRSFERLRLRGRRRSAPWPCRRPARALVRLRVASFADRGAAPSKRAARATIRRAHEHRRAAARRRWRAAARPTRPAREREDADERQQPAGGTGRGRACSCAVSTRSAHRTNRVISTRRLLRPPGGGGVVADRLGVGAALGAQALGLDRLAEQAP